MINVALNIPYIVGSRLFMNLSVVGFRYGVFNTPLSPLVSPELLDHYNCFLNGTAIEEKLHFSYHHPVMTIELVIDSIRKAVEANIFPNVTVGGGSPLIRT